MSGVANTHHLCPGFGRGMQVLAWETLSALASTEASQMVSLVGVWLNLLESLLQSSAREFIWTTLNETSLLQESRKQKLMISRSEYSPNQKNKGNMWDILKGFVGQIKRVFIFLTWLRVHIYMLKMILFCCC